ncbi:hypothetical protein BP6252_00918 [Coleophoma cylindrospora]|uniref:Nucleoporin Nup120 n=1 Tax=Coleophoma cylindrospora TaxID=1849047 RepID=A0A3D8SRE9_9HELO|nr:hypothetical protein BP6252_00918 [Coleophoma cylindrospora]
MAETAPFYAYKELRLNLDPAAKGTTVAIRIPAHGSSAWPSRTAQKRPHIADVSFAGDEEAFKQKFLATAASIYHRKHHKSPRSFLWRILEDGKVLSIRAVDVSKQNNVADANITLRLMFPTSIKHSSIAFSDSPEHDILSAFILTESKQLYTLNLRPDYFRRAASTEDNVGDWCKVFVPSAFSFKHPHRLIALSADQILISTIDGGLMRLQKNSGSDGTEWKETHYSEGSWGLRSLIPFQGNNTIPYGKFSLEQSVATSLAAPPKQIFDTPYIFTVCLDHKLRIWNLETGKIAYNRDILDPERDPQDATRPVISPSYSQLVKVIVGGKETALCVTYSPNGSGQFKFWDVVQTEDNNLHLIDLFPGNELVPQPPTSDVWTLADFSIIGDKQGVNDLNLWLLWKNNTTYRVQKLGFSREDSPETLQETWGSVWEGMAPESLTDAPLPTNFQGDAADSTDKWLSFIFMPGRFTTSTIETCLAIYETGLGASRDSSSRRTGCLAERLCSTIASTSTLGRKSDGEVDYEQFRAATDAQWRRFYRLLLELNKQRGEALSLVIDPQGEMPWVASADGVSAIRACSALERFWHNQDGIESDAEDVLPLMTAAMNLRDSFSDQLNHSWNASLLGELFEDPSEIDSVRIKSLYDKCDFSRQIGDEEYGQLVVNLGDDFKRVTPSVYEALLRLMAASDDMEQRPHNLPLAEFGIKLIVKGVQETVELHRNICLDQLALLVFIEVEINHGEEGIEFDTAAVFRQLISMLKRLELVGWLANTELSLPLGKPERSDSFVEATSTLVKKALPSVETVTVLEGVLRHLLSLDTRKGETMSSALTDVILQICDPDSEYEARPPALIQCFLLKHERADLAVQFSRFAETDPFSTYIRGRVYLAVNDALAATALFKKAAFGMAYPNSKQRSDYRSAGFLEETEKNLLNAGLPEYYSHIVALFDKAKIYSYVIDFAGLALQFLSPTSEDQQVPAIRKEMHIRMFNAAIQTSRYDLAHSTLALFTDSALQLSSIRTLVTKMCEASYATQLIELPFIGMQDNVDNILAQKCESIVDVNVGVPYHKILYSWRIKRSDFRGAAAISYERLQKLQQAVDNNTSFGEGEGEGETPVTRQYVSLINALSCVDSKQAWILSEPLPPKPTTKNGTVSVHRKVVTLDDIRKSYQEELDRLAAIENDQFAFTGGDAMDVL